MPWCGEFEVEGWRGPLCRGEEGFDEGVDLSKEDIWVSEGK